jgi:hypothetical protein
VNPKKDMSVFNKDPELLIEPMGLDAVEVTEPLKTNKVGFHIIPDGPDDDNYEAGKEKPGEPSVDASKANEASTTATATQMPLQRRVTTRLESLKGSSRS